MLATIPRLGMKSISKMENCQAEIEKKQHCDSQFSMSRFFGGEIGFDRQNLRCFTEGVVSVHFCTKFPRLALMPVTENQLAMLQLSLVSGVGPRLYQQLLTQLGDAQTVLQASRGELEAVPGVGAKLAHAIGNARDCEQAKEQLELCRKRQVEIRFWESEDYPTPLSTVDDAPKALYLGGTYQPSDELAVGIVGSRNCTLYGRQQAERFARALALAGVTVISGMARGIDAAAHYGALQAGGRTIAVMATGLGRIYPPEHAQLSLEIRQQGALVSESPIERGPSPGLFPQRNRIISGLSRAVIVIEASRTSGSLHTARHAYEQGRDVFALPGRVDEVSSRGCLDLLKDGAILARDPEDVLEELRSLPNWENPFRHQLHETPVEEHPVSVVSEERATKKREPAKPLLSESEAAIYNVLESGEQLVDVVIEQSGLNSGTVLSTLTMLELRKLVKRLPGNKVKKVGLE